MRQAEHRRAAAGMKLVVSPQTNVRAINDFVAENTLDVPIKTRIVVAIYIDR